MPTLPAPRALKRQILGIQEIATLPHVMDRILRVIEDDASDARDLAREIAADASLTAKILKIVNSAFYGHYRGITLVSQAVVVLGFEEIKRISLAISVLQMFENGPRSRPRRLRLWLHCLHTATLAEMIARDRSLGSQGAFTAGLLHDLGRVVLSQHVPEVFDAVVLQQARTQRHSAHVERDLLGATHADVGSWLADRWHLPPNLAAAIRHHHTPEAAPVDAQPLVAMVHVADVLAHEIMGPTYIEETPPELDSAALRLLGCSAAEVAGYRDAFGPGVDAPQSLLSALLSD